MSERVFFHAANKHGFLHAANKHGFLLLSEIDFLLMQIEGKLCLHVGFSFTPLSEEKVTPGQIACRIGTIRGGWVF